MRVGWLCESNTNVFNRLLMNIVLIFPADRQSGDQREKETAVSMLLTCCRFVEETKLCIALSEGGGTEYAKLGCNNQMEEVR